ncbi:SIS domain-containing protein [bacterium]|nr:SIS domain-containing protein [bacterium]
MNAEEFLEKAVRDSLELKKVFFNENRESVLLFWKMLKEVRNEKRKVLIFGNGGSAADAQHFAAELMHKVDERPLGMKALALHTDTSLMTAIANDHAFAEVYAQQIAVLAEPGDLAVAISTTGTSSNIVEGLRAARRKQCRTAGLLGRNGGAAKELCDVALVVSHDSTPRIQEVHGLCIHVVCQLLERNL